MSAQHTPGPGIEISLRIGQRVRHRDHLGERVTGVLRGLSLDSDRVLQADLVLDAPIVIPARSAEDRAISIWHQHVPAHELAPFDDRDELMAQAIAALKQIERLSREADGNLVDVPAALGDIARAAIAKVAGSAL
ncbi:hypothetical protein [Variovorax sp. W2I14]|uniref:hypothetical protein n=1 Tax=Variovorax sp. W2I14 TaxID=3042290 RepID=UPI003D1C4DCB